MLYIWKMYLLKKDTAAGVGLLWRKKKLKICLKEVKKGSFRKADGENRNFLEDGVRWTQQDNDSHNLCHEPDCVWMEIILSRWYFRLP